MNKITLLLLVTLLISLEVNSQTYVSGGIYSNTTWSTSGSPYLVTDDLTLFPGNTLTIEPGVSVEFYDSVLFQVRGSIYAAGTEEDSVRFTGHQTTANNFWLGIKIDHELGGIGTFRFCIIKNSQNGVFNNMGLYPHLEFRRCSFENNYTAVSGYAGNYSVIIDSCYFHKNVRTITHADKIITNSVFTYNDYGLYQVERMQVINCIFCGNIVGINANYGNLVNSVITKSRVGIESDDFNGIVINTGNLITENDTGVHYKPYGAGTSMGTGNIICNNNLYNIVYQRPMNLNVTGNCWCETDSLLISEKIYDGYDDPGYGLLIFSPVMNCNSSIIPDTVYCSPVTGIKPPKKEDPSLRIYPNPFTDHCIIEAEGISNAVINIYDITGKRVRSFDMKGSSIRFERGDLKKGLYLYRIISEDGINLSGKLLIN